MTRQRITIAQIGARRHYAIPSLLHQAGFVDLFYTDVCANHYFLRYASQIWPRRHRPSSVDRLFARSVPGVPNHKIRCFPWFGVRRFLATRRAVSPSDRFHQYLRENQKFCQLVVKRGFGDATAVYVFNGAGLEILREAKARGMAAYLEQTSPHLAHEEAILAEEREYWPGWEFEGAPQEVWAPMAQREHEERKLADLVLCGSTFVRDSLQAEGEATNQCIVVPYGYQPATSSPLERTAPKHDLLRVLFVGTISLRKGIQYLMQAAKLLGSDRFAFRAVGPQRVSRDAVRAISECVELVEEVSRSAVRHQYEWADVLVLPSLSEGSANVCYEALSAGVPVITTHNAGSIVRDGIDGFIVPIRDAESIAQHLQLLERERDRLYHYSTNAHQRSKAYGWSQYRERLLTAIEQVDLNVVKPSPAGSSVVVSPS